MTIQVPEVETTVIVRDLTRMDRVKLTLLIQKFVDISGTDSLVKMVPSSGEVSGEEKEETAETRGSATAELLESAYGLIEQMLTVIDSDMANWFCELIGVSREAYDALPFDIEVQVIEGIILQKGFGDFFTRGSRVFSKIKQLVSPFKPSKTQ